MDIHNHPNYLIYPDGKIWSKERLDKSGRLRKGKFMKEQPNKGGYRQIILDLKNYKIHRLIAEHYIPNPDNKPEVDHINRIRDDNRIENLRWVYSVENAQNTGIRCDNKTGHKNISYHKQSNTFAYRKMINNKSFVKHFKTLEEALEYKSNY